MTARQPGGPEPGAGSHRQACLWSDTPRPPHCGGTWLSSSCPPPGGLSQQTRTHHRRTRGHGSGPQNSHLEQVPCTAVATERGGHTCRPTAPPPGPQAAVRNRHQAAPTGEGSRPRGLRGAGCPRPAVLPQLRARRVHEPQRRATWLPHAHQDRRHLSRTRHETSTWGFPNAR